MTTATVRVPASSANLGAGFDALGIALDCHLDATFAVDARDASDSDADETDEHHLAVRTFRSEGGTGPMTVRAAFPGGRGLGFSAAAIVAGIAAAAVQRGAAIDEARTIALERGVRIEGHADNVAASVVGGAVSAAGDVVVAIPLGLVASVLVWIPQQETSTKKSRAGLPDTVAFADAVFNIGRASTFVAALAAGDVAALRVACDDRLHQQRRFAQVPDSAAAYEVFLANGAWCAWLSGSGPSVAALCAPDVVEAVSNGLPDTGRCLVTTIDTQGTRFI